MFGTNLKRLRAERQWSQSAAARAAGISIRSYQNWEGGSREPRLDALKKLASAFGVSADVLLADASTESEVQK